METNTEPQQEKTSSESSEVPFVDVTQVDLHPQNRGYAYEVTLPDGSKHNVVVIAPSATDAKEKLQHAIPPETTIIWKEFVATHVF